MKKIAVLVVSILFYASVVPIVAETPEITEARLAGENDANGFNWKWFGISYLISNSTPLVFMSAIWMIEEFNLYDGTINNIDPRCCLAAYGIYVLAPTVVAMTHSPALPAERLLGKSSEWVNAYTKAYQKSVKRHRTDATIAGYVAGTATLAGTLYLIFASIGGNTAD